MPATPEKTQEEINKNIVRITKLLEMHGKNPAEVKAQKKEEQELIKQEKLLQEKWVEVIDDEKKELEKRKVGITSLTSFIGLEAKKYFAATGKQMYTWGGLFDSFKTGVKSWFDAASKQNTMLGRTLRLGASLWKGVNDHIIGTLKNVFGKIGSQVREVLGELAEVFDVIKGIFMGVFNFIKDSFLGFFKRVPPEDRKRNKLLQEMVGYMRRREKRELLELGTKKGGGLGGLGLWSMLGLGIAAVIGGMIRAFLLPFEVMVRATGLRWVAVKLFNWITSFKSFAKIIFTTKWKFITWGRQFMGFLGKLGVFGRMLIKLGSALKFGFKFLGWPLTIILGVIDFIRGFASAEGNLADKITAGVKAAIFGFIELPVKLIGWLVEKILGLFGVEVTGVADKIMGFFSYIIDFWVGMFRPIIGFFEGLFKTKGSFIERLKGAFSGFLQGIMGMFDKMKPILKWFGIDFDEKAKPGAEPPKPKSSLSAVTSAEAKKDAEKQQEQTDQIKDELREQTQKQIDAQKQLAKEQGENVAVAISGGSEAPRSGDQQIADEVDNVAMMMMNQLGGMG